MTTIVSTWMYVESAADGGLYPQVGGPSTDIVVQKIYWRCVYLFFVLAKRSFRETDDVEFQLFTNVSRLPKVDGVDLQESLESQGVEIVKLDYTWRPRGSRKLWFNQYYIFDILNYWVERGSRGDDYILCDSDCVFVRSSNALLKQLREDLMVFLDIETTAVENINGVTRAQAGLIYRKLGSDEQVDVAPYFGGECFGLSHGRLVEILDICRRAFAINNDLAAAGLPYLSDEAHLLSFAAWRLGRVCGNANKYAKRIWTGHKSNNTGREDLDLVIWHVPAEKLYGLKKIFEEFARRGDVFLELSDDEMRMWLASKLGVGRIYPQKIAGHLFRAVTRKGKKSAQWLSKQYKKRACA